MVGRENQVIENRVVILMKFEVGKLTQKDVKNGGCSGWLIENKGTKEVLWMS